MSIINLLIWILVAFGISNGIANSKVFKPIREYTIFKTLLSCVMCMGFWVGVLLGYWYTSPTGSIFLDGFLASASSWLIYLMIWEKQQYA